MGLPKPIEVVPYQPSWPAQSEEIARVLHHALAETVERIEHVGSTAIPCLPAKPILDIDVVLSSSSTLADALPRLVDLGYHHEGDLGIAGREAFERQDGGVPRNGSDRIWPDHHLYVCASDSRELARHLAFRDALRASSEDATRYGRLKHELAHRYHDDREAYVEGKSKFIAEILERLNVAE